MVTLARVGVWTRFVPPRHQSRSTCAPDGVPVCGASGDLGFACTRRLLHPGDHHAHVAPDRVIAAWPQ